MLGLCCCEGFLWLFRVGATFPCRAGLLLLRSSGFVALQHVGSPQIGDRTCVLCVGGRILNQGSAGFTSLISLESYTAYQFSSGANAPYFLPHPSPPSLGDIWRFPDTLSVVTTWRDYRRLMNGDPLLLFTRSCPTLCDPMDCSTPGFPVHHQLPELAQIRVHCVGNAIQPSHPLSSPSPTFNPSQHQGLFK